METKYELHATTYEWMVRLFNRIRNVLGLNIKLHGAPELLEEGEIFVFNHFARIETFLPHWLIYTETGALCRSIASHSLFKTNDSFANFLSKVGVLPNNHKNLFSILVVDIMRGRKVVIFPEGGMVKDRKVLDKKGRFLIFSREANEFRKHHSGAAVLANAVNIVKKAILLAYRNKDQVRLSEWSKILGIPKLDRLIFMARKRTNIIPCNITFYPIRTDEGFLLKQKKLFNKNLSKRVREELIVESNILFQHTDMDVRPCQPIYINDYLSVLEKLVQKVIAKNIESIKDFDTLEKTRNPLIRPIIKSIFKRSSEKVRDRYMEDIYRALTVNILHLASLIILQLMRDGVSKIRLIDFYLCLYLGIKQLQLAAEVHLHRELKNPEVYRKIFRGEHSELEKYLETAEKQKLLFIENKSITLKNKLLHEYELDTVRITNTIQVYANEIGPVLAGQKAVEYALLQFSKISSEEIAEYKLDDEFRNYDWHYQYYSNAQFDALNKLETATESGRPFFVRGSGVHASTGVLLVHGFLASPAEMVPVAEKLEEQGYTLYAPRLAGHGTSPEDLQDRTYTEWVQSVRTGYEILSAAVNDIVLLGFSTGALLAFYHASEHPQKLRAIIGVNSAFKLQGKSMMFVPFIHGLSKVIDAIPAVESTLRYRNNIPEHPEINYQSIPIQALHQLQQLISEIPERLLRIKVPCLLIQSSQDPVVSMDSFEIAQAKLVGAWVKFVKIESSRHGILYENTGTTFLEIMAFLKQFPILLLEQQAWTPESTAVTTQGHDKNGGSQ